MKNKFALSFISSFILSIFISFIFAQPVFAFSGSQLRQLIRIIYAFIINPSMIIPVIVGTVIIGGIISLFQGK